MSISKWRKSSMFPVYCSIITPKATQRTDMEKGTTIKTVKIKV